jgi:hypothetical protein
MTVRTNWIYGCCSVILIGLLGCAPDMVSVSEPVKRTLAKTNYQVEFEPLKQESSYFRVFRLSIHNKSNETLQIDWHQTYYTLNGRQYGTFVTQDTKPGQVNDPARRFDTILAGSTYSKNIAPLKLIAYAPAKDTSRTGSTETPFTTGTIPEGKSGIHLFLKDSNRDYIERIAVTIKEIEKE